MVVAGVAAAVAGARGPGGPEGEFGPWGGHWHPQGLVARPRPRQLRGEASGLVVGGQEAMEGEWPQFWGS